MLVAFLLASQKSEAYVQNDRLATGPHGGSSRLNVARTPHHPSFLYLTSLVTCKPSNFFSASSILCQHVHAADRGHLPVLGSACLAHYMLENNSAASSDRRCSITLTTAECSSSPTQRHGDCTAKSCTKPSRTKRPASTNPSKQETQLDQCCTSFGLRISSRRVRTRASPSHV